MAGLDSTLAPSRARATRATLRKLVCDDAGCMVCLLAAMRRSWSLSAVDRRIPARSASVALLVDLGRLCGVVTGEGVCCCICSCWIAAGTGSGTETGTRALPASRCVASRASAVLPPVLLALTLFLLLRYFGLCTLSEGMLTMNPQ